MLGAWTRAGLYYKPRRPWPLLVYQPFPLLTIPVRDSALCASIHMMNLGGVSRVMRTSTTPGGLRAIHILIPQDHPAERRVCANACTATGCLSTPPVTTSKGY